MALRQTLNISNIDDILLMLNQKLNKLENLFYIIMNDKIYENDYQLNILKGLIKIFNLIANKQIDLGTILQSWIFSIIYNNTKSML